MMTFILGRACFRLMFVLIVLLSSVPVDAQQSSRRREQAGRGARKLNVLFISVDDLRPIGGAYGDSFVRTPHMDALARRGVVFNRAYAQQAVCSPSRTSLLTGRRPDTTRVYDLTTHFRQTIPDVVTLPQHFKQQGYHTQSFGKIYHNVDLEDAPSWSVPPLPVAKNPDEVDADPSPSSRNPRTGRGPAWRSPDVADKALFDGRIAGKAIDAMRGVKDKPFFLAVGFTKPHLPFVAPKKYYDMYPLGKVKLPANPFPPKDVPRIALADFGELRAYADIPEKGALSERQTRELIRGYYAATSYVDAQIGRMIDELDRAGLRDNTIVVLWGDHGYQLGEHGLWNKHTNFEVATRSPLIISAPGMTKVGKKTDALVEFVDVYPTLIQLAALPMQQGLEGTSLVPLLHSPKMNWKRAAFSQYPRGRVMGYSIRTNRYRYTEWSEPGKALVGVELYDHRADPAENINIANLPENNTIVAELSRQLKLGWRAAGVIPKSSL